MITKRELDKINAVVRRSRSKYWSGRYYPIDDKNVWQSSAILDKFCALLHTRQNASRFMKLKTSKAKENYLKAKDYALAGPKGKLP